MKPRSVVAIGFSVSMLTVLITIALGAQDVPRAPNGLGFSDFNGYETRLDVAESETGTGRSSSQASSAAGGNEIFHVAIFRFAKEHVNDARAAFRALASASRRESGNRGYDIYRGTEDDQTFYVVEHWASPAALAEHERTEAFIHFGQGVLVRWATLHGTVTARAFDIG